MGDKVFLNNRVHISCSSKIRIGTHCDIADEWEIKYNGFKKLYLSDISGGHLLFDHNISGSLVHYIKVKTKTLQQIIDENSLENIDYLKMDCEGSEGHILKSTPQKYLQKIRSIVLKFHNNVSILNHNQIINLLSGSGYKCNFNWDNKSEFGYIFATRC